MVNVSYFETYSYTTAAGVVTYYRASVRLRICAERRKTLANTTRAVMWRYSCYYLDSEYTDSKNHWHETLKKYVYWLAHIYTRINVYVCGSGDTVI